MTAFSAPTPLVITPDDCLLQAAMAAYLGRYRGQSHLHTGSDLKVFLIWCADHSLDPLRVGGADIERYVCWLQQIAAHHLARSATAHRSIRLPAYGPGAASTNAVPGPCQARAWRSASRAAVDGLLNIERERPTGRIIEASFSPPYPLTPRSARC